MKIEKEYGEYFICQYLDKLYRVSKKQILCYFTDYFTEDNYCHDKWQLREVDNKYEPTGNVFSLTVSHFP